MQYLLDTCVFLWWLDDNEKLTKKTRGIISDPTNIIIVSSVSVWEIVIKQKLGKLEAPDNISSFIKKSGFETLSIQIDHAEMIAELPDIHNDPFDRMLIAQAITENLTIITNDKNISKYKVKTVF